MPTQPEISGAATLRRFYFGLSASPSADDQSIACAILLSCDEEFKQKCAPCKRIGKKPFAQNAASRAQAVLGLIAIDMGLSHISGNYYWTAEQARQ